MSNLGNKEIFAKNLKYYMQLNHKDRNDVCRDLEIPYTTFAEWYNGNIYPRIDKIQILANYFDIKKSDLVEEKANHEKRNAKYDNPIPLYKDLIIDNNAINFERSRFVKYINLNLPILEETELNDFFGVVAWNNEMIPLLDVGDIAIIYKKNTFKSGNTCLIILDNKIIIRKIVEFKDYIELQTVFPFNEPIKINNNELHEKNFYVLGKVVRVENSSAFK